MKTVQDFINLLEGALPEREQRERVELVFEYEDDTFPVYASEYEVTDQASDKVVVKVK